MHEAQFRIGASYWNGYHDSPIHVIRDLGDGWAAVRIGENHEEAYTQIRLVDGQAGRDGRPFDDASKLSLIPGELVLRDGQWVAVEEAKEAPDEMTFEELVADLLSPSDAAMIARQAMRPKDYAVIWPELAPSEKAKA